MRGYISTITLVEKHIPLTGELANWELHTIKVYETLPLLGAFVPSQGIFPQTYRLSDCSVYLILREFTDVPLFTCTVTNGFFCLCLRFQKILSGAPIFKYDHARKNITHHQVMISFFVRTKRQLCKVAYQGKEGWRSGGTGKMNFMST